MHSFLWDCPHLSMVFLPWLLAFSTNNVVLNPAMTCPHPCFTECENVVVNPSWSCLHILCLTEYSETLTQNSFPQRKSGSNCTFLHSWQWADWGQFCPWFFFSSLSLNLCHQLNLALVALKAHWVHIYHITNFSYLRFPPSNLLSMSFLSLVHHSSLENIGSDSLAQWITITAK